MFILGIFVLGNPLSVMATMNGPRHGPVSAIQAASNSKTMAAGTTPTTERLTAEVLFVGDVKTLRFPSIKRIVVGNGKVLNAAAVSANEVLVIAENTGTSVLSVWDKKGHEHRILYRVNGEDTSKSLKDLSLLVHDIPSIRMREVGDKVVVEGDNVSSAAQEKLEVLARQFPNLVNMTNPVTWEKMILLDVRIVEFNTQALKELGINWSTSMQGPAAGYAREWINNGVYRVGSTDGMTPIRSQGFNGTLDSGLGYFGIATAITSQINLMAREGKAVILAEPKLSARSGSDAHFLAGGEIPLPVRGSNGDVNVFYKEYGIVLDIKPESGGDGTIRATIKAEVSSIDSSITVGGFPGFLKRQTNTEVNLKENETLVISGLVSSEMSKDINKVPFLGDIPVIGRLFKSSNFRNKQTELVFFVTPHLINAQAKQNQEMLKQTDDKLEKTVNAISGSGAH